MTELLKDIPLEVLKSEIEHRELMQKKEAELEVEYLSAEDIRKLYGYKTVQAAYRRIKEDGIRDGKYKVRRTTGNQGHFLIDKKSFMEFWNGGEEND